MYVIFWSNSLKVNFESDGNFWIQVWTFLRFFGILGTPLAWVTPRAIAQFLQALPILHREDCKPIEFFFFQLTVEYPRVPLEMELRNMRMETMNLVSNIWSIKIRTIHCLWDFFMTFWANPHFILQISHL